MLLSVETSNARRFQLTVYSLASFAYRVSNPSTMLVTGLSTVWIFACLAFMSDLGDIVMSIRPTGALKCFDGLPPAEVVR